MPRYSPKPSSTVVSLYGEYDQRTSTGSSVSASGIVGLGVVGVMIVGSSVAGRQPNAVYLNCVPDTRTNKANKEVRYSLAKRPGFAKFGTVKANHVSTAIGIWSGKGDGTNVITAFGNTNSEIFENTTSLGSITGQCMGITETILSGTPNLLFTSDDDTGWFYPNGGALTKISDGDFPGNAGKTLVGNFVVMDGYTFIMADDGTIWNSDLNSVSAWGATSFLSAQMYPDKGVGLLRYKNNILAFGKETLEFFYNSGSELGSPLASVRQAAVKLGCVGYRAMTQMEDTVVWVSSSDKNGIGVYILDGYVPRRISTPSIDAQLQTSVLTDIFVNAVRLIGKTFIIISITNATLVYCVEEQVWTQWNSAVPIWHHMIGTTGSQSTVYTTSEKDDGGHIYSVTSSNLSYQDNGQNYTFQIQTPRYNFNTQRRKFCDRVDIIADKAAASSTLLLDWSDDDYNTWSTARSVDLNNYNRSVTGLGSFRRRAFRLTNTDSNYLRLESLELQLREGVH